jgi:hypothetical protein
MKRIIDGKAYNTDSATIMAMGTWKDDSQGIVIETTVYKNRAGSYFAVEDHEQTYRDRDGEAQTRTWSEWKVLEDEPAAEKFCQNNQVTIYQGFDAVPEAGDMSETETIYVRVPRVLKLAVEAKAKTENVSINTFAMRCLESCTRPAMEWTKVP